MFVDCEETAAQLRQELNVPSKPGHISPLRGELVVALAYLQTFNHYVVACTPTVCHALLTQGQYKALDCATAWRPDRASRS